MLGAAFQRVLFVSAQYVFKQIVDKVQPDDTPEKPSEVAKTHDAAPHKLLNWTVSAVEKLVWRCNTL